MMDEKEIARLRAITSKPSTEALDEMCREWHLLLDEMERLRSELVELKGETEIVMSPEDEKFAAESFERFMAIKEGTDRLERAENNNKILLAAIEDIASRLNLSGAHEAWSANQVEPCTCVMHVAKRALDALSK